ncbi:hypothetical protein GCM10023259_101230 [Thermocatellispora tengchongensis]
MVKELGLPGLHFHDLRHTGNMLAAESGTGLKDLTARMGHDNVRAAMIYQHAVRGTDEMIKDAIVGNSASETKTAARARPARWSRQGDQELMAREDPQAPRNDQGPGWDHVPDLGLSVWSG